MAEDGRAPSIWDTFSHTPGTIDRRRHRRRGLRPLPPLARGHRPDEAARRRRLPVLDRLAARRARRRRPGQHGGPRLLRPAGRRAAGGRASRPFVTLYHWDLPQALQDRGGWPERDTAEHFAAYASVVAERLGDRVTDWATLNEPLCSAWIGHLEGRMAPGLTDLDGRRARLVPPAPRPRPRRRRRSAPPSPDARDRHRQQPQPDRAGHRPRRGPRRRRPRRRPHQPLVAGPDPRPRLPAGHARRCTASTCPSAPATWRPSPRRWTGWA